MSRFARVDSIDSLQDFRVALCKFTELAKNGLNEAEAEIQRAEIWVKQDQATYWKAQVRRRREEVTRAKIALKRVKESKSPLGGRYSGVDEAKALKRALQRSEEAERKLANVHRWSRQLEKEAFGYKGLAQALGQAVELDVPVALAHLDKMIDALSSYVALTPPGRRGEDGEGAGDRMGGVASGGSSMARGEVGPEADPGSVYGGVRENTPSRDERDGAKAAPPTFRWPRDRETERSPQDVLGGLHLDRGAIDPAAKVVLAEGCWDAPRVYLERVEPAARDGCAWYIGPVEGDEDRGRPVGSLVAVRATDFLALRPDFSELLRLPAGFLAVLDGGSVETVLDANDRQVWPTAE